MSVVTNFCSKKRPCPSSPSNLNLKMAVSNIGTSLPRPPSPSTAPHLPPPTPPKPSPHFYLNSGISMEETLGRSRLRRFKL
ncbi:hypothetical protein BT69DRAFT_720461 [Atractiella rhizophila]|nr:hypothetical protein BT69DRAFT_720461 [Atractiella rhizophila]